MLHGLRRFHLSGDNFPEALAKQPKKKDVSYPENFPPQIVAQLVC